MEKLRFQKSRLLMHSFSVYQTFYLTSRKSYYPQMRIGLSPQQPLSSFNYNLDALSLTEKFCKSVSPYIPCDNHPFTNLTNSKAEIEESLRQMDMLYSSNFLEFVKEESSCERIGPPLSMMCRQYPLYNIVLVVEFITESWSTLNKSKLLFGLTYDWHPDFTGQFMNSFTKKFNQDDRLRISLFLLKGEDAESSALYLKSYMSDWSISQQSEFIQFLEQCLSWDLVFFDEFLFYFLNNFRAKCKSYGYHKVIDSYKLGQNDAVVRLKKLFENPDYSTKDNQSVADELVTIDLQIYLTMCIQKSCTNLVMDQEEINEHQRSKVINWMARENLVSVNSFIDEDEGTEEPESCLEEPRSYFRQLLDRFVPLSYAT
eukprot:NODE_1015_length_2183_cov_0.452975.p1 type:complete len:372 gc:universal NODE_1015_length_2183_cov_0.452975:498-1613(+)